MTAISKYFVSLQFHVPRNEIKRVDNHLKVLDKKFKDFQKGIGKTLELPALKVKKFDFDHLALQRNAQMELNKVSRLLELPIKNFTIDQNKLNRQVQTSMQRAANQAKIVTKTVTGNSGGYGVFNVHQPRSMHLPMPNMPVANGFGGAGAMGLAGGVGAMMGGAAVAAPLAAVAGGVMGTRAMYAGNRDSVANRNLIANVVSDPKLSAEENEARGKKAYDFLYELSNKLGQNAKANSEVYAQVLAGGQANGLSLEQSQKLYTQLLEHSTVNHLPAEKLQRLIAASVQILGKGQLYSEEVKGQIAEASPTLPSFIAQAYAESTKSGNTGAAATKELYKAMEEGKAKVDVFLRAMELASKAAQPNIERSSQTSQSEANRLANKRSYLMNEASVKSVEDGFYRVNKALNVFAEDLTPVADKLAVQFGKIVGGTADFALGVRGIMKDEKDGMQLVKDNWQYLPQIQVPKFLLEHSVPGMIYDRFKGEDESKGNGFLRPSPMIQSRPEWMNQASKYSPPSLQDIIRGSNISSTQNNNITLNINSPATNANELARDLEPHIESIFRRSNQRVIGEALLMVPHKE